MISYRRYDDGLDTAINTCSIEKSSLYCTDLKALYSGFRLVRKDQLGCRLLVGIIFYAGKADLRRQQAIVRGYDGDRAEKVSTQNTTLPKEGRSCSL